MFYTAESLEVPLISIDVVFPASVYHGTVDIHLESFKERLLNKKYWKYGRDFGQGFYTTNSIEQAKSWARSMRDKLNEGNPCVLEINIDTQRLSSEPSYHIFTGISSKWAKYIYQHRTVPTMGEDPCQCHANIIIGPMADADTGKIVQNGVRLKKDSEWFLDKITRNHSNRQLDSMELGNQIAFSDENLAPMLTITGIYLYQGRRWRYNGNGEEIKQL
ncbi:DUF3990 domain-containing protein [Cohnella sp. WQ 127256]|uniref:DUF3990 domain-containing protein n=1 Tax=Cohnella sp. WQ 127256 TaxID=2938790 RepID=UPI0021185B56|nr:DUF3990 domain-containing protein [Cohnella sp. WQ 127256]